MALEVNSGNSGSTTFIAFICGAILVAVAVVGFFMWDNFKSHQGVPAAPIHVIIKK